MIILQCQKLQCPISGGNSLSTTLSQVIDSLQTRKVVNKLLNKCKNISKDIKRKVDSIVAHDDKITKDTNTEDGEEREANADSFYPKYKLKPQPSALSKKFQLKSYQIVGMNWLILMNKEGLNSILADEMGLGKFIF